MEELKSSSLIPVSAHSVVNKVKSVIAKFYDYFQMKFKFQTNNHHFDPRSKIDVKKRNILESN